VRRPTLAQTTRRTGFLTACALIAAVGASCSGHRPAAAPVPPPPPPPSAPPTTPAPSTTTTTKVPAIPRAPLTGLVQRNSARLRAPAVVVKIDNVDAARPQTGLNQADVVYEEMVEGGLTRLAAVYQSYYPSLVGPVRSGRLTDAGIADDLNHPVLAYSGTNAIFLPILQSQPLTGVNAENDPALFPQNPSLPVPHNTFTDVAALATLSTTHAPPPPLFSYLPAGVAFGGTGAAPVRHLGITFPSAQVTWDYNSRAGGWLRGQNGTEDLDSAHQQVEAANVVVLFVSYITSGIASGEGVAPTPIPEGILTGSGQAWFLSAGKVIKGTWSRSSMTTVARYRSLSGAPIRLTPGRTWVELVPAGTTPSTLP
jgi:Protein of unknown function (DUF3048) N-terminal domain/Protein of unknown function (DUF3048) C-terminal domain